MTTFKKTIILFFSLLITQLSVSDNIIIEHYTVEDGLAHEFVNCVVKSSDGFLWLGTWHGLCSFDGKEMKSYNSSSKFQVDVPPRKIQKIIEDAFGNLWIKTIDHKIYVFDKRHEQFHSILKYFNKNISVNSQVIRIMETEDGNFLLLTKDKDLMLATPKPNAIPEITLLHKSDNKSLDSKLRDNILKENNETLSWIGMDFSIQLFNKQHLGSNGASKFISNQLPVDQITSFCSVDDYIWIGSKTGSVFCVEKDNGIVKEFDGLKNQGTVQYVSSNNRTQLFVYLKDKGIFTLNLDSNETSFLCATSANIVHAEYDNYGLVWFVTDNNSIILYDDKTGKTEKFEFPVLQTLNSHISVVDGSNMGMFFLTISGRVYRYDRDKKVLESLTDILGYNNELLDKISDILIDSNGTLWLTSYDQGFLQINFPRQNFEVFNPIPRLGERSIKANNESTIKFLFQDNNGDIWVANRNSEVFQLSIDGRLKNEFSSNTFNIGNVYNIMQDRDGILWFSTKGQGLVSAVPDSNSKFGYVFERYVHNPEVVSSITSNDVYYSFQDSRDRIWVATFGGGLNLLQTNGNNKVFKHLVNSFYDYPNLGQFMEVRTIAEDSTGRIWVGTTNGLMSFDGDFTSSDDIKFETYLNDHAMLSNDIYYFFKDKENNLWVSIFGVGVNKLVGYDSKRHLPIFETYGIRDGLNSDVILTIKEDDSDNLWFSTERGLSRLNKKDKLIRNFDRYDGVKDMSFVESSSLYLRDGKLWFGSLDGVLGFCPDDIVNNTINYPTYIVDIKVSNKDYDIWSTDSLSVRYLDNLVLTYDQSLFTIEYAALNFSAQNHISYKYILEGFEKEWHEVGTNRVASFSNVPHGKYTFRVKTEDVTNPLLDSEITLQIKILPPWWKSTWAYIVYIIIASILIYTAMRITMLFIKMRNDVYIEHALSDLKLKFFTNISHELRTPLTLIQVPIEELKEENLSEKGRKYIGMVEKNAIHMVDLVNQILDFRKIENNKMRLKISLIDLNQLVQSLFDEFMILSDENEISYDLNIENEDVVLWADKDKLEIVIRNIISNAFKFTPVGGSILVTTGKDLTTNTCYIRIDDSGVGIAQNKISEIFERYSQSNILFKGTGIGLALSKELVILHHGEIKVESVQNEGTTFTVELPLGKEHFNEADVDFYLSDIVYEPDSDESNEPVADAINPGSETRESVVDSEKSTLLIVEDNKSLCNLLRLQLEDKYNIITAHDGEEGFTKVHIHHPDIVITDQMMPKVGGLEMLEQIRSDFQISHIPVIVLTAKNDDDARLKAFQLGANAYITKPFSKKHLVARVEQLLKDRRKFRERLWNNDVDEPQNTNYGEFLIQKDVEFLDEVHRIIEENMNNSDFNIDVIAVSLNLSRSSFFKKLKSITGLSPIDLVREIRLNKAVELIKNTDLTVTEIAFAVGFKDPGYFGKCFRKKYNLTPREYSNEYRNSSI